MNSGTKPQFRTTDVPVAGGTLRVAIWGDGGPIVLCSHGLTANHTEFQALVDQLGTGFQVIAPDHRGRGHSAGITGPWGMAAHADDLVAVLEHLRIPRVEVLLGHSMGGFVAAVMAARNPDRVATLMMVDGGIPLANFSFLRYLPFSGWLTERLVRKILGPSLARLDMTFESPAAYTEFWKKHPAFAGAAWSPYVDQYIAYDLIGSAPALRSSTRKDALWQDVRTQLVENLVPDSLNRLRCPVRFLRAAHGILNATPLYDESKLAAGARRIENFSSRTLDDVNHFTILISAEGARKVADEVRGLVDGRGAS